MIGDHDGSSHQSTDKSVHKINIMMKQGGGIAQFVSHPPHNLGTWVRIPVRPWLGSPNDWMRGEEIASCKSHIAFNLTNCCIIIFKKQTNKSNYDGTTNSIEYNNLA